MDRDSLPFAGMDDIPDPAAYLAAAAAPEPSAPADPSPTRADRARLGRMATAAAAVWIALVAWSIGLRGDLRETDVAIPLVVWIVLAGFSLMHAQRPRPRGLPAGVRAVQGVVLAIPVAFLVSIMATTHLNEPTTAGSTASCLATATGIALAPLALAGLVLRRSFLSAPAWRGAAIGALCGLGGTMGIHAHCPANAFVHVAVAHGLPIVLGALLGAAAGALQGRA